MPVGRLVDLEMDDVLGGVGRYARKRNPKQRTDNAERTEKKVQQKNEHKQNTNKKRQQGSRNGIARKASTQTHKKTPPLHLWPNMECYYRTATAPASDIHSYTLCIDTSYICSRCSGHGTQHIAVKSDHASAQVVFQSARRLLSRMALRECMDACTRADLGST